MTCGYLCKTTITRPTVCFFLSRQLLHLILAKLYFYVLFFFSSNWLPATTSRVTPRKLNWSIQGKHPLCILLSHDRIIFFELVDQNWTNLFPQCFSVGVILFSFIQKHDMQQSFLSKLEYKKVIKKSALTVLNTDGKNHEEPIVG